MKTVIINASPRKNMNTAMLLKAASEGAASSGSDVEYIDLYDLDYSGCRSCLACKLKSASEACRCYWKDGLSPVLESIYSADCLILGTPVYYGSTSSGFHALFERLVFPAMSYNDYSSNFNGKLDIDVFLTMNVGEERYESNYAEKFRIEFSNFKYFKGRIGVHPCFDTMQVDDYSKYEMASWDPEKKKLSRESRFAADLQHAYAVGRGDI